MSLYRTKDSLPISSLALHLFFILGCLFGPSQSAAQDISADNSSVWFKPELTENNSTVCENFFEGVLTEFNATESTLSIQSMEQIESCCSVLLERQWCRRTV